MKPWIVWSMYLLLVAYNVVDAWHTYILLNIGLTEGNWLLNYLITKYDSFAPIVLAKIVAIVALGLFLLHKDSRVKI